jgi:uncharacterized RDD family membrane protein YckC
MNPYEAPNSELGQHSTLNVLGKPVLASVGKRFLAYIADRLVMYLVAQACFDWILSRLPDEQGGELASNRVVQYGFPYLIALVYYFMSEAVTGRTIGKLLAGTKVLSVDYTPASLTQILGRSICRLIPFEPLSAFGPKLTMLHDTLSDTITVDLRSPRIPPPRRPAPGEKPLIIRHPSSGEHPPQPLPEHLRPRPISAPKKPL